MATVSIGAYDALNINSGYTLTANTMSLGGGSITGAGSVNVVMGGAIQGLSGFGTISAPLSTSSYAGNSGFRATNGTLNINGSVTAAGENLGVQIGTNSTLSINAGGTLTLKSTSGVSPKLYFVDNTGTLNLNGGTLQGASGMSPILGGTVSDGGPGTINVTKNSTLTSTNGAFISSDTLRIGSGITLNASGANFVNNGTVNNNGGTASWGNFTNNGAYNGDPSTNPGLCRKNRCKSS